MLAERLRKELEKHDQIGIMDYFDRCAQHACWQSGNYCDCHSRYRECLPEYSSLDPSLGNEEESRMVIAELFNIPRPVSFRGSRIVEKGSRNKPIEITCETEGGAYRGYVKKMVMSQDRQRSLVGLELTRLLRQAMDYIFTDEYQITAYAGVDLEEVPVDLYRNPNFAFQLGVDEAFRELVALEDVRPANQCYNGGRVITLDLESVLNKFVPVKRSHQVLKYEGMHLLDEDKFQEGIQAGKQMILAAIGENIEEFARLVAVIESNHIDLMLRLKKRQGIDGPGFSNHVLELIESWS